MSDAQEYFQQEDEMEQRKREIAQGVEKVGGRTMREVHEFHHERFRKVAELRKPLVIKSGNVNVNTASEENLSTLLLGSIISNIINKGEEDEKEDSQIIFEIVQTLKKHHIYYEPK